MIYYIGKIKQNYKEQIMSGITPTSGSSSYISTTPLSASETLNSARNDIFGSLGNDFFDDLRAQSARLEATIAELESQRTEK